LMTWKVDAAGAALDGCSSAFDGDADMAYALLLAERQWGNGGAIDYRAAFNRLIAGIEQSAVGPESRLPMLGDWVDPAGSGDFDQWCFRTSDVMPGHFRAFAAAGRPVWSAVVTKSQAGIERLQTVYAPQTGLLPDFAQPEGGADRRPRPASPDFLEGDTDGAYNYNAGRDPWRIGVDALTSSDGVSREQARRLAAWSRTSTAGVAAALRSGYNLDGTPLDGSNYFSSFFAAPFGVAAMADPEGAAWLRAIYDAVREAEEGYYEDSVTLLCLLVMTRNFWSP
ncbi:MAG: glycosyl hydrolase family 8, partial [bacterium]